LWRGGAPQSEIRELHPANEASDYATHHPGCGLLTLADLFVLVDRWSLVAGSLGRRYGGRQLAALDAACRKLSVIPERAEGAIPESITPVFP
jgi:hypothetical protein